jgi:hypothetical protein
LVLLEQPVFASAQIESAGMPPIHPTAAGYGAGDVADLLLASLFLLQGFHEPLALH